MVGSAAFEDAPSARTQGSGMQAIIEYARSNSWEKRVEQLVAAFRSLSVDASGAGMTGEPVR